MRPVGDPSTNSINSLNDLAPELSSLHDLASRGSWRSIVDKVIRARKVSLVCTYPHQHLTYKAYYVLALTKLRRYEEVMQEMSLLEELDSAMYRYETYPELYGERCGSMVLCGVARWLGQQQETLDRLHGLLEFVRRRIEEKGGLEFSESLKVWRKRESFE